MIHQTSPACGSLPIEVAEPKGAKHIDLPVNDVNWAQDTIGIRPLDNLCEGGHWSRWSGENPWCFGSLIVYKSPEVGFHHLPASTGLRISKWLLPGGHLEGDGWRVHHLVAMPFVIHQSSYLSDSISLSVVNHHPKKQKIIMICGPYIWAAHTSGSHSLAAPGHVGREAEAREITTHPRGIASGPRGGDLFLLGTKGNSSKNPERMFPERFLNP